MSKSERQRKQSIRIAIAAMMFATCTTAAEAVEQKAKPAQARVELTAAAQSIGGSPSSAKVKTATPAPTASPKPKSKDAASQRYADLNADKKPEKKPAPEPVKKKVKKAGTTMLVPPPPPTIPTYLNVPPNSPFDLGLGFSVPAMSLDDLKFQQKNVEKKLESAKIDENDQKRLMEREQERAKQFDGLFADGIVSRRELETAKEDAERSVRKLEQTHISVAEKERLLSQIKERIQSLEAAKKPMKISSKKSSKRK